jgi:anti-sigma regulatory factor (Ser/Thr protein kinase)
VGGVPSLIPDAELLVSELVTNAVVHTDSSSIQVQVTAAPDGRVRCTVVDEAPDVAPQVQPVDHTRVGGSGLKIVETIATRWGCDRDGSVKSVWFELEPA